MPSDYKPLNDFMCGLIALIFNFTLLDFWISETRIKNICQKEETAAFTLANL